MRKRVKKLLFVLMMCLCMFGFTITAFAATEYVEGYLRYTVEDGSVTITGYNGRESEVTIPSEIAGVPVNTIASGAFSNAAAVTKINLPDTIMTIEEGAFTVGQTVVYNSNTEGTVVTEPEQPATPPTENPTEAPAQEPTEDPSSGAVEESTSTPAQNTKEPTTQSPSGSSEDKSDGADIAVADKTEGNVREEEKAGSVEEVDVDFDSTLEDDMAASESVADSKEQNMENETETVSAEDTDTTKADNMVFPFVMAIVVIAAAVAGVCVYRKKGQR